MRFLRAVLSAVLVCLITLQCLPASACSFWTTVYFTYTTHPDIPLTPFARGRMGVILDTYARSYLVIAYRYLEGKPLSAAEQQDALHLWADRMSSAYTDVADLSDEWLKARATIPGLDKPQPITVSAPVLKESYNTFCNCQPDGFKTAVATLKERVTKYGATSDVVKQWVKAQDQVFSNCGFSAYSDSDKKAPPPSFPQPLPDTADLLARQDRAYQIAAAHFYAKDFDTATKEFAAIAAHTQSPWSTVSRYLAVRCLIRKGMLSKEEGFDAAPLKQAEQELQALLQNPSMEKFRQDMQDLLRYCQVRVSPATLLVELSRNLQTKFNQADLNEYTRSFDTVAVDDEEGGLTGDYDKQPDSLKTDEMTDWILTLQSEGPMADKHAMDNWKSKKTLPWLVAALTKLTPNTEGGADVVAAAEKLEPSSPAYFTAAYYVNDWQIAKGQVEPVRARLNLALDTVQPELPPSSRNLFRMQREELAGNLDAFMRDAFQKPVCICGSGGIDQVPDDPEKLEKSGKYPNLPVQIPFDTEQVVDGQFPLSVWLQAIKSKYTVSPIKQRFIWSGFTRALLVKNEAAAKQFAEMLKTADPKYASLLNAYTSSADAKTREFAGAFILLKNNRAVPQLGYGDYDQGEVWWWGEQPAKLPTDETFKDLGRKTVVAKFLTPAEKAQATAEFKALNLVPTAPNYLSSVAIAWAKAHPGDVRVPEALHLAVRTTRYGQTTDATKQLSKEAFQILHTRYKGNPWTAKTPYFY